MKLDSLSWKNMYVYIVGERQTYDDDSNPAKRRLNNVRGSTKNRRVYTLQHE